METDANALLESDFMHAPYITGQYPFSLPENTNFACSPSSWGLPVSWAQLSMPDMSPSHLGPGALNTQSTFADSGPPISTASSLISTSPSSNSSSRKAPTGHSRPRKVLTDEDRRIMCLYSDENPHAKQKDIAALFEVNRSTVSKVLKLKEKYLDPRSKKPSSKYRAKEEVTNIEKALSNWIRNNQCQGLPISEKAVVDKAMFFARACGSSEAVFTESWLKVFKQENNALFNDSCKGSIETPSRSKRPIRNGTRRMSLPSTRRSSNSLTSSRTGTFGLTRNQSQLHAMNKRTDATSGLLSAEVASQKSASGCNFTPIKEPRLPCGADASRSYCQIAPLILSDSALSEHKNMGQNDSGADLLPSTPADVLEISNLVGNVVNLSSAKSGTWTKDTLQPHLNAKIDNTSTVNPSKPPTRDDALQALDFVLNYFKHQQIGLAPQECLTLGRLMERLDKMAQTCQHDRFSCN